MPIAAPDRMWRVGIDTGGTFTDLVAIRDGEFRTAKVPSTPPAFDDGVLDALAAAAIPVGEVVLLAHGTTATTNAVITKTGARTGLITTKGFRDVLELRRAGRSELTPSQRVWNSISHPTLSFEPSTGFQRRSEPLPRFERTPWQG
jgi:N-methylhydantoinase A